MSRVPFYRAIWLWCFVGTAIAALSTAIPLLGELFILFGAPLFPIVLINGAFVAMALDAITSRVWLLLVLPVAWFGGYAVIAAVSHNQAASLRRIADTQNERAKVHWNKASQSVMIKKVGTSSENLASDITPAELVERYGLGAAFGSYRPDTGQDSKDGDSRVQRVSIDGTECPNQATSMSGSFQFSRIRRGGYPAKTPMQWARGVCLVFQSEAPPPDAPLTINLAPASELSGLVEGIEQDISIGRPNRPVSTLRAIQIAPLPWLPMPIIGCHYKGGYGDRWDRGCHAEFRFVSWRGQAERTPVAVSARALGLEAMTIEQRLPGVIWQ